MTYKKEFPRDMSFVDREGKVVIPSREDLLLRESANVGKAYAFFDCVASKQEIETKLPKIREYARTPSQLELSLMEVKDLETDRRVDPSLLQFIKEGEVYARFSSKHKDQKAEAKPIRISDLKYMFELTYPHEGNKKAAMEMDDIMNVVYGNWGDDPFNGTVVYEENGQYVFRD